MNHLTSPSSWINSTTQLNIACQHWLNCPALAIDTEFIRTNTFYPIPALIQIYDGEHCYLIDPQLNLDLTALRTIFTSPNIVKVLHSCSEDLEVFDKLFETLPTPIFDTQIAAAFLGYGFSVGYARLIKDCFNIDIPKEETRSNWLQRPLSNSQINYAALDVIHLYQLYEKFSKALQHTEKEAWVSSCNQALEHQFIESQKPENYFSRIKNAWKLPKQQQQQLYQLILWREQMARKKDKPRSHLIADDLLTQIAFKQPVEISDLSNIQGFGSKLTLRYGEQLLEILHNPTPPHLPQLSPPLPKEAGSLLKKMRSITETTAKRLNIAPEMLARKKDFQALAQTALETPNITLPSSLNDWRSPIIGAQLINATQEWLKTHKANEPTSTY